MKKGFTLLEVLVSMAMLGVLVTAVFPVVGWLITKSAQYRYDSEAAEILQEGAEAAYNIMLATTNWGAIPVGQTLHVQENVVSTDTFSWTFDLGPENDINAKFDRWLRVDEVCRDSVSGNRLIDCSGGATVDTKSRLVTVFVEWEEAGVTKPIKAELLVVKL